jgi:integrase
MKIEKEIKLYLDKSKARKTIVNKKEVSQAPLKFIIKYNGERFFLSAFQSVLVDSWITEEEMVSKKMSLSGEINKSLETKRKAIDDLLTELKVGTQDILREQYQIRIGLKEAPKILEVVVKEKTLSEIWESYRQLRKGSLKKRYYQKFITVENSILSYSPSVKFETMDQIWWEGFVNYLTNRAYKNKSGLSNNTISYYLTCIKQVSKYAQKCGIKVHLDISDFRIKEMESSRIFLSWEELQRFALYTCAGRNAIKSRFYLPISPERLSRDIALLTAYLGFRFSDVFLKAENFIFIDEVLYVQVHTRKSKKLIKQPVNAYALEILQRYNFNIPKISGKTVNRYIQKIAREVGIDKLTEKVTYIGNQRNSELVPKYQLLTHHCMRHSYACNALQKLKVHGILALKTVQEFLGHSDLKTTMIYAKMLPEQKDQLILEAFQ